jgi:tRNA pseudouridine38-40 synthase
VNAPRRKLRLDLAYDGTGFAGWQEQPGAPTVQGLLRATLSRLQGGLAAVVRGAGRTDAGVHARGQVADAVVATRLADAELQSGLNALLPRTVRVTALATVDTRFDARRDAVEKTYTYSLDRSRWGDPFRARYALWHPYPMDRDALADALRRLPGQRDWSGFTAAACALEDRVRHLTAAAYHEEPGGAGVFTFTADGFLTHMVRNLVGTLLEVARGAMPPEGIDAILAAGDRRLAGPTAAPRALCLEQVVYRGEEST